MQRSSVRPSLSLLILRTVQNTIAGSDADLRTCSQSRSPALIASELREKLLREKVMALRKSSSNNKEANHGGA